MSKRYAGDRTINGIEVTVDGAPLPEFRDDLDLTRHGFEWGYEGVAPAQLAFAVLRDHLGEAGRARELHEEFMRGVVANFGNEWEMTSEDVDGALAALGAAVA